MDKDTERVLRYLAQRNLRGITSSQIVCDIQAVRDEMEDEQDKDHRLFLTFRYNHLLNELERRTRINDAGIRTTNRDIIATIKEKIPVDMVLSWYTDVFTHAGKWTYRCTLHGDDKHPSGVIYRDENRFHCFACGAHGDIVDAVQLFERMELIEAIKKLAHYIGLSIKPFETSPTNSDERLRQVELKTDAILKAKKESNILKKEYIYNNIIDNKGEE